MPAAILVAAALAATAATPPPAPLTCADPAFRQLDFWTGDWELEFDKPGGGVGHAHNHVTRDEYGDCVIAEHFRQPDTGYVGGSYSIYDRKARLWRQTWVDSGGGVFVLTGGPVAGQPYVFELRTSAADGPVWRMIWQDVSADRLTWRWQGQQADGSWRDAWVLRYRRAQKSP